MRAGVTIELRRAVCSLRQTAGTAVCQVTNDLVAVKERLGQADVTGSRGYVQRASLRVVAWSLPR